MRLIAAGRDKAAKPIDRWSTSKLGMILRHYNKEGLTQVGVDGTRLTIEIERFRNGSMIR